MPTTVPIIVNTGGGGDYPNLKACADDLVGYDMTATDEILHVKCRGGEDTAGFAYFNSMTADATRYMIIETDVGHRTNWTYPFTSGYWHHTTADASLLIGVQYTKVRNMAVQQTATGGYPSCIYANVGNVDFENVLAISDGTAVETYPMQLTNAAGTIRMRNVHCFSHATGAQVGFRLLSAGASKILYLNNCSFFCSNYRGFEMSGSGYTLVAKNCMFHGSPIFADSTATYSAGSVNNAYFHGSAPTGGASWVDYTAYGQLANAAEPGANQDLLFVDEAGNFRLNPTSGPGADGTDLSADPNFPVTTDITGENRNGVYYLGAFGAGPASRDSTIGERQRSRRRRRYWFFFRKRRQG